MHNNNMYEWGRGGRGAYFPRDFLTFSVHFCLWRRTSCSVSFHCHVQCFPNKNTFEIGGAAALRQLHQLVRARYPMYTLLSIESGTEYFFNYLQAETFRIPLSLFGLLNSRKILWPNECRSRQRRFRPLSVPNCVRNGISRWCYGHRAVREEDNAGGPDPLLPRCLLPLT